MSWTRSFAISLSLTDFMCSFSLSHHLFPPLSRARACARFVCKCMLWHSIHYTNTYICSARTEYSGQWFSIALLLTFLSINFEMVSFIGEALNETLFFYIFSSCLRSLATAAVISSKSIRYIVRPAIVTNSISNDVSWPHNSTRISNEFKRLSPTLSAKRIPLISSICRLHSFEND